MNAHAANEANAAEAFGRQSAVFDELYGNDPIIRYKRFRVRRHLLSHLKPGAAVLELNAGTGEDAQFLAGHGFRVHATDISTGMLHQLKRKTAGLPVTAERCSFSNLHELENKGPFDAIFSNFGGLNCTGQLDAVLGQFDGLLAPGGTVTLVIISKFCLWETLLALRGDIKTAVRRFFSKNGRVAKVEGKPFRCWYYSPSEIIRTLAPDFRVLGIEALCALVPPSYLQGFAERRPKLYRLLVSWENAQKDSRLLRSRGDYFIISLQKR